MASTATPSRVLREAGTLLREMRVNSGLSPEALGAEVGVSGWTIRRIERGSRPTVRTMFLIAQRFECEVVDLWPH